MGLAFLVRYYKPSIVNKHLDFVNKIKFSCQYNPTLPTINNLIKQHLDLLHSDDKMKDTFPRNLLLQFTKVAGN